VELVRGDASHYDALVRSMTGVDLAFYLVHSMEGTSANWAAFAERDRTIARNFARAATECGVKRIVYLGGLAHSADPQLSMHMRSRREVGEILKSSTAKVTIFRAAVIIGEGGSSFRMMSQLVDRLPVMVCPRWVTVKSQPIAVEDVISYLSGSIETWETAGKTYDIGGPEVMTYLHMMRRYAKAEGKSLRVLKLPFLTLRLSSYWVDLVTDTRASLARPLIDSLSEEAIVKDDSIGRVIPLDLKTCDEAMASAIRERKPPSRRSKPYANLLLGLLLGMAAFGFTYYPLHSALNPDALPSVLTMGLWLFGVCFALYFVRLGVRLGGLSAGIVGWLALGFWAVDIAGTLLLHPSGPFVVTVLCGDALGVAIAAAVIVFAHMDFHYEESNKRGMSGPGGTGQSSVLV
jgi:uncharacterized protein YbjT (DUF2867 family)